MSSSTLSLLQEHWRSPMVLPCSIWTKNHQHRPSILGGWSYSAIWQKTYVVLRCFKRGSTLFIPVAIEISPIYELWDEQPCGHSLSAPHDHRYYGEFYMHLTGAYLHWRSWDLRRKRRKKKGETVCLHWIIILWCTCVYIYIYIHMYTIDHYMIEKTWTAIYVYIYIYISIYIILLCTISFEMMYIYIYCISYAHHARSMNLHISQIVPNTYSNIQPMIKRKLAVESRISPSGFFLVLQTSISL